ncbi:MAG TPA: diguanylate cyclase [Paucimonas sp.]|nr:diguanylate cyclase [Paucimonas sp.]
MHAEHSDSLAQLLMSHVSQSGNGVAVLDAEDRFLFHNAAFAQMFGFDGESMVGRSHDDMLVWMYEHKRGINIEKPSLEAWLAHVHERHRAAPFRNFEVDLLDGRWILLSEQVFPDGKTVLFCSEITRQKKAEFALAEAHAELERLALTDELTGLPNRRYFLQKLDTEITRARRYRRPLCLGMMDLDHFKQINDRFGHPAGDDVLRHFSEFVGARLRASDLLGRLGGEEFALLMPETPIENGAYVLRRISELLSHVTLSTDDAELKYTFSAGVVSLPLEDTEAGSDWLLAGVDKALYRAKAAGRNRIAFA